jgi:hypothetical protein
MTEQQERDPADTQKDERDPEKEEFFDRLMEQHEQH